MYVANRVNFSGITKTRRSIKARGLTTKSDKIKTKKWRPKPTLKKGVEFEKPCD